MDTMLWVCGGIALVSAILALIFLPRRAAAAAAQRAGRPGDDLAVRAVAGAD